MADALNIILKPAWARRQSGFLWLLAGNGAFAFAAWASLLILSRLGTAAEVGAFAYALALASPVFLLGGMNLRNLIASDVDGTCHAGDYLTLRAATTAGAWLATVTVAAALGEGAWVVAVVAVYAAAKAVESGSELIYGFLQRQDRMRPVAVSLVLRSVLGLVGLSLGILAGDLRLAVTGLAVGWLLVLLVHDLPRARWATAQPTSSGVSAAGLGRLVMVAAPLGVLAAVVSLQTYAPMYVVEHRLGRPALGFFAPIVSIGTAMSMVVAALGQSMTPRLAVAYRQGDLRRFYRTLGAHLAATVAMGTAAIAAAGAVGGTALRLAYGEAYEAYAATLLWVMVASLPQQGVAILGYAALAQGRTAFQPAVQVAGVVVLVLVCAAAVDRWGITGAAASMALSWTVTLVGYALFVAHYARKRAAEPARSRTDG